MQADPIAQCRQEGRSCNFQGVGAGNQVADGIETAIVGEHFQIVSSST